MFSFPTSCRTLAVFTETSLFLKINVFIAKAALISKKLSDKKHHVKYMKPLRKVVKDLFAFISKKYENKLYLAWHLQRSRSVNSWKLSRCQWSRLKITGKRKNWTSTFLLHQPPPNLKKPQRKIKFNLESTSRGEKSQITWLSSFSKKIQQDHMKP